MRKEQYQFTVFTPTYNRALTLDRLYQSLLAQSYTDFEWLIIDDGSEDNTKSLVEKWIYEKRIPIRYFYQENTHKFFTILKASQLAKGTFLLTFDSDDEMFPNTLQDLWNGWLSIPQGQKATFSGVTGLCENQYGELVGDSYPTEIFDSDSIESNLKYRIKGEKCGFQKASIIKAFSFSDEYKNNGYIPEGILWMGIAEKGYKTRYINKVIRKYYIEEGHESIMNTFDPRKNSFGAYQASLKVLNLSPKYFAYNPRYMIINIRTLVSSSLFQNINFSMFLSGIKPLFNKIGVILLYPLGYFFYKKHQ